MADTSKLVRVKGLEPPLSEENKDLNLARLPVPPHPQHNLPDAVIRAGARHSIKKATAVNLNLWKFAEFLGPEVLHLQQGFYLIRRAHLLTAPVGFMIAVDIFQKIPVVDHQTGRLL